VPTGQLIRFCGHECLQCATPTYKTKMREVLNRVAAYYEVEPERLKRRGGHQHVRHARLIAAYLLIELFPSTRLQGIAEVMGYKDRTGLGHAATACEHALERDADLGLDLETLRGIVS